MKKKFTKQELEEIEGEIFDLVHGDYKDYKVEKFTDYHYRINNELDIWPTKQRYWFRRLNKRGSYRHEGITSLILRTIG